MKAFAIAWQWKIGGGLSHNRRSTDYELRTGVNYNFSDDWAHAFYLGAGIGFGTYYSFGDKDWTGLSPKLYSYVQFGKRLTLNKAQTITWNPHMDLNVKSASYGNISIYPLSFGFNF